MGGGVPMPGGEHMLLEIQGQPSVGEFEVYGADPTSDEVRWPVLEGSIGFGLRCLLENG